LSIKIGPQDIEAIFFDFDGVFTDNKVWTSSTGEELVVCSKSDSLGLDSLRQFIYGQGLYLRFAIISMETNEIVHVRAQKLGLECFIGVNDKAKFIADRCEVSPKSYIYFGNDINDIEAMRNSAISLAPDDAEPSVKEVATFVGKKGGGNGFVREGLEYIRSLIEKG
jgi:YrbI family 3-deoxy-D-manno-octulosonate 8-phosphate phosphatase